METVLITGGNRGLGLEAAKQLLSNNYKVIITSRSEASGKEALAQLHAISDKAHLLILDVTNQTQQDALVKNVEALGGVDVLLNNAGAYFEMDGSWMGNTATNVSQEILKKTFEVNFFSVVELTQKLLPIIEQSDQGRIVNVSSIMASMHLHANPDAGLSNVKPLAYDASKSALNAFTIHLAAALKEKNIAVNSVHPGWVQTDMGTSAAPMTIEEGAKTLVDMVMDKSGKTAGYVHLGETLPW